MPADAATLAPINKPAPPAIALKALNGAPQPLAAQPNRLVLVHFFATWCAPCRDELQALNRLAADLGAAAPLILAVDVGEPEIRVRRFFDALPVSFPVLLDPDKEAMRQWGVEAFPTTFALRDDGTIVAIADGEIDWTSAALRDRLATLTARQAAVASTPPPQPMAAEQPAPIKNVQGERP